MIEVFVSSLFIGYSGAIMPGPLFSYAVDKSIKHGSISGLLLSIGHVLLELIIVVLILSGLSKFLGTDLARAIIGAVGGLALLYLAVCMLRDAYLNKISVNFKSNKTDVRYGNMLVAGAVISVLNPGFVFWWAVVGLGLTMSAYASFGIEGVIVFFLGHILADISWYCFLSILISKTRSFISIKIYKGLIISLAGMLLIMASSFIYRSAEYFFKL